MIPGNSLAVQWLGLCGPGSIPGQGSKIAQAMLHSQKQTNKANKPKNKKILFQINKMENPASMLKLCLSEITFLKSIFPSFTDQLQSQNSNTADFTNRNSWQALGFISNECAHQNKSCRRL